MRRNKKTAQLLASLAFMLATGTGAAADLVVDTTTGKLTGATGVQVFVAVDDDEPDNGTTQCFDVRFEDSRCGDVIPGCDGASAFVMPNSTSFRNAAQALLDQVFLSTPFDTDPSLTQGCADSPVSCDLYVPYRKDDPLDLLNYVVENTTAAATADVIYSFVRGALTTQPVADVADIDWTSTYLPTSRNSPPGSPNATWAVFSPCPTAPVPETSSVTYILYALIGLVLVSVIRTRRTTRRG